MKKLNCSLLPVLCSLLIASCASAPELRLPRGEAIFSQLPAGGRLYLWVDAARARPFLEGFSLAGFDGSNASQFIDNTDEAIMALYADRQGRSFYLAATGNFPASAASVSLRTNRDWAVKRSVNGINYWYSEIYGMALALGPRLALVSDKDPFDFSQREIPPEGFAEFHRGLALAGWIPNPIAALGKALESLGIPIQIPAEDFLFGVGRLPASQAGNAAEQAPWELVLRIKTPSEAQARSILTLFSMARLFSPPGLPSEESADSLQELSALFFANSPEQDGEYLTFRLSPLSERGISLLLGMFSLY